MPRKTKKKVGVVRTGTVPVPIVPSTGHVRFGKTDQQLVMQIRAAFGALDAAVVEARDAGLIIQIYTEKFAAMGNIARLDTADLMVDATRKITAT